MGRRGQMIRKIGSDARKAVERLVGGKVYLDLWVKVRKGWREDETELRRLGFERT
ncbi:MAG: KH domain-containing protein [Chloroflexota bacterium]